MTPGKIIPRGWIVIREGQIQSIEKPGTVSQGAVVEVDCLLSVESYWKPEPNEHNLWLTSVLSHAKHFILCHKSHPIVYGDLERVMGSEADEYEQFSWMNEHPASETDLKPRNFVEQLGMRTWGEVTAYLATRRDEPWWYRLPSARVAARRKFDELILSGLTTRQAEEL